MIINNARLETSAVEKSHYPDSGLPEFAFVGKSNVGKSSLINCLVNRKALARTSQNPGKTRTINFFNIEDMLLFVDLPGYGYAKISRSESEKWGKMVETYLLKREQLRSIIFLIDIRHEPSANDKMMYEWLRHYGKSVITVATKSDKLSRNEIAKNTAMIRKTLELGQGDTLLPFSSETKSGRDDLWDIIKQKIETSE